MDFASSFVFVPEVDDVEEIFTDEVEDGIASCAQTQAQM